MWLPKWLRRKHHSHLSPIPTDPWKPRGEEWEYWQDKSPPHNLWIEVHRQEWLAPSILKYDPEDLVMNTHGLLWRPYKGEVIPYTNMAKPQRLQQ